MGSKDLRDNSFLLEKTSCNSPNRRTKIWNLPDMVEGLFPLNKDVDQICVRLQKVNNLWGRPAVARLIELFPVVGEYLCIKQLNKAKDIYSKMKKVYNKSRKMKRKQTKARGRDVFLNKPFNFFKVKDAGMFCYGARTLVMKRGPLNGTLPLAVSLVDSKPVLLKESFTEARELQVYNADVKPLVALNCAAVSDKPEPVEIELLRNVMNLERRLEKLGDLLLEKNKIIKRLQARLHRSDVKEKALSRKVDRLREKLIRNIHKMENRAGASRKLLQQQQ